MPHYSLSWRNPNERLFDVSIRFIAPEDDPLLWLPAWRPGRYLIMNFAANVREWSANLRKVGKSEWRVSAKRAKRSRSRIATTPAYSMPGHRFSLTMRRT